MPQLSPSAFLERLRHSETGRQVMAEYQAETHKQREAILARIEAIDAEASTKGAEDQDRVEKARKAYQDADAKARAAGQRFVAAERQAQAASMRRHMARERAHRELEALADPAIAEFVHELGQVERGLRNNPPINPGEVQTFRARQNKLRELRNAALELRYSPSPDVGDELAKLRADLGKVPNAKAGAA